MEILNAKKEDNQETLQEQTDYEVRKDELTAVIKNTELESTRT